MLLAKQIDRKLLKKRNIFLLIYDALHSFHARTQTHTYLIYDSMILKIHSAGILKICRTSL